jgi:hypothetical protein
MKTIYTKLSKTASLSVTCHPVEWFQNWQDAETVMTEMAKAWVDENL